jgi:hypothetical protein
LKLEELKKEWTAAEIRMMVKLSALELLQQIDAPPGAKDKICRAIDEMSEDEIYERAYESFINSNN